MEKEIVYDAKFERCINFMCEMIEKYGHIIEDVEKDAKKVA